MHSKHGVFIVVLLSCINLVALASRVVQLVAENPSPFVSANPDDPRYIVSIFDDVAKAAEFVPDVPAVRSTIMTDADGQQFNCSMPSLASWHATALAHKAHTQLDADMSPATHFKSPFELLELLTGMCLYRQDGLWTYEVCHRKHVRQFRQVSFPAAGRTVTITGSAELEGMVDAVLKGDTAKLLGEFFKFDETGKPGEDFSCGQYTGDDQQSEAILEDTSSSGHPLKYVSHFYTGGAKCVLTGQPRTAEVRYTCVRDTNDNVVLSVREFPTCNYVVVVSTPFLCRHHQLVPQEEDLRLISCVPLEQTSTTLARKQKAATSSAALAAGTAAAAAAGDKQQQQQQQQPDAHTQVKETSKHSADAAASLSPREDDELLLLLQQIDDTGGYFDEAYAAYDADEYLDRDDVDKDAYYGPYDDDGSADESRKKASPHEEL